jgi:plastocyanin
MMSSGTRLRLRALGVACALVAAFVSGSVGAQGAPSSVQMQIVTFDPAELHVAPGTMVTWTNPSALVHTVTADDGSSDSGDVAPGNAYTQEFDTPGTYAYYCQYHGGPGGQGMAVVIVVDAAG